MRTVAKNNVEKKEEVKQEFTLTEAFVLWKKKAKSGVEYLSGYTTDKNGNKTFLNGFFNSKKENPKAPDIRIMTAANEGEESVEVAILWENLSKDETKRYLTGHTNDNEKLVGFYGDKKEEKRPYIRVYFN